MSQILPTSRCEQFYREVLQEALLLDASSSIRTVPGAVTSANPGPPFSTTGHRIPRRRRGRVPLVGIETNPGPTPTQDMINGLATALGSALAKTEKKKVPTKPAPKRAAATKKKTKSQTMTSVTQHLTNNVLSRAPVSGGVSYSSRGTKTHPIISMPFNSVSNSTLSVLSTASPTVGFSTTATTISSFFDLTPYSNVVGGLQDAAFGIGLKNVSKCFAKWRIRKLIVTYIPAVSTATSGSIALGATGENYLSTPPTFQQVTDCERMIVTPVWQGASIDITSVAANNPNEWLYVYSNTSTAAEQRQCFCCSLMLATFGLPAPTTTRVDYGQFRFDGIIEFTDMSDIAGGISTTTQVHQQPNEECKDNHDEYVEEYEYPSSSSTPIVRRKLIQH